LQNSESVSFMSVSSINKLREVISHNLCNRCGSCVGLSQGNIVFSDKTGRYLPKILHEPDDITADLIWKACAGKEFNFPLYRSEIYPESTPFHVYTGSYRSISIGHASEEDVRKQGASGGILSAILTWLLENGMIDGAVVTGMSESEPWLTRSFIATTPGQILEAAQSKYIISSVNEILPEIGNFKGRLAYVGLPGQVQSIRKLQQMKHPWVQNISYVFGPFYGNTLHFSSVISFLRSYGYKDYTQISKLYFRHGEWPGNMRVEFRNGEVIQLPKFHANYLIPFHILKNSLLCTDLSNEFTDISGGDAWAPVYEERGKGYSMVIARSEKGQQIIELMQQQGILHLDQINENEAITMHSHGYDLKKRGSFIRIKFRKMIGLPVPDYGYTIKGFSFIRYLMEAVIVSMFLILGTRLMQRLVELMPPAFIGNIFERMRKLWKRSTYGIKRSNL
jgi:coenzyme F420 hydrogenase subunit beta